MGKKLGLGIIGILVVGVIYYFTAGAELITEKIKAQVNKELSSLREQGFSVQKEVDQQSSKEEKEHFTLSFDNPQKISNFFISQGAQLTVKDIEMLKGLTLGVDISYQQDVYSAVSFDLYPLTLPDSFMQSPRFTPEDKTLLQLQEMLKKKTFLVHVDINKLGSGFKGYIKDIHEVFHGDNDTTVSLKNLTYTGELKNSKLKSVTQNMQHFSMHTSNKLQMTLANLKVTYMLTGDTLYDYNTNYNIEEIVFDANKAIKVHLNHLQVQSNSSVTNALASGTMTSKVKSILIDTKSEKYALKTLVFELGAKNLDIHALDKLQKIGASNEKEVNILLQKLLSNTLSLGIPAFSVASIEQNDKKMEGFELNAKVGINKPLDIKALQANPMSAISAINAHLNLNLSKELYELIAQQPQAMMALMLFQPKDVKGKKSYEVDLKDGKLLVNGSPVF